MAVRPMPRRRPGARRRGAAPAPPEPLEPRVLMCSLEPLPEGITGHPAPVMAAASANDSPDPWQPPASGPGVPQPPAVKWTTGLKRILYVRATFADQPAHVPQTLDSARRSMAFADAFVRANSYGKTSFAPTFTGVIVLPEAESFYLTKGWDKLRADALAAAKAQHATWDQRRFDLDLVRFDGGPAATGGTAAAWAYTGGRGAWLRTDVPSAAMHELGHNLGLNHANLWQPSDPDSPAGPGANVEYGNPYDVMGLGGGAGLGGDLDAYEKNFLGWLPDSAVRTVDESGVYTVLPADATTLPGEGQVAALRLRKDDSRTYWLSPRADPHWSDDASMGGLEVMWGAWSKNADANSNLGSQLLDMTPQTAGNDYGLAPGHTFTDALAGLHVTPLRRDAAGAVDVAVYFDDPAAPDTSAPQSPHIVSSNASDPYGGAPGADGLFPYPVVTVAAGADLSLTASSRDADGDDLAYAWDFGPDAATGAIGPGGMASPLWSGDLATPAATTRYDRPGVYRVRVAFSDLRGRTSSSSVLVRVTGGTPDSTSADNIVTGRVVDAFGQPMADVRVGDGSRWTWTDSDGSYALAGLDAAARPLAASRPGGWAFEPVGFDNPVTPADFTRADFRGTPAEHRINGVVTSLAGFGVKDVLVSDGTRSTLTDGLGRFSLPEPDGVYDLTFDKPGFPISPAVGVAVDDADTFVPAEAHVDAVVGAVRGAPAGAATFVSYGGMQPGQQAFGGRYELADVPRGTWAFFGTATTPDRRQFFFLPAGRANPITIDGQQGPVDFQLIPAGTYLVTGRVTRGADAVPGVRVTAVDKVTNRVAATTVTDDSGRYVLPALPGGAYNVTARKEGLDLAPLGRRFVLSSYRSGVDFHVANPPPDLAPTLVEPASTDSPIVTGTSGWMSALAEDDRDTDRLVYTWSVVSAPAGASVAFSRNAANPAQRTLATFDRAGVYEIRSDVTDTAGNRATSTATVTVAPVLSSVRLDAAYATVAAGTSRPYRAAALDQFGRPLTEAPAWSWEAVGGIGSVAPDGTFTAGDAASRGAVVVRASSSLGAAVGAATVDVKPYATVAARRVFYNNSVYDDFNAGANGTDFDAVAPDKRPLLPGDGAATAANYTAYDKGINGIMLDLDGAWATELTAADFQFLTGPGDAAEWVEAPRPRQVATTTVQGDGRPLRRVTLIWDDGAIRNRWLRVTVLPTARTGLAASDVFAFGNLGGDAGDASPGDGAAVVTDADVAAALKNRRGSSTPSDPLDHNRDFAVNDADADVARRNLGAMLQLITGGDLSQSPVRRRRPEAPITG